MLAKLVDQIAEEEREKGIVEGRQEGRQETALKMMGKGYPLEEITGLPRQELEQLFRGRS